MNEEQNTTTTTTALQLTGDEADDRACLSLEAAFHYAAIDPLAVTMVIMSHDGPVPWTFARDLLVEGFYEPTGDGDVHVWPCLDTDGAAVLIVELESPAGGTLLQFRSKDVEQFIRSSLATTPQGAEEYDVDEWIQELLADADTSAS
jgi:hypothetical protein